MQRAEDETIPSGLVHIAWFFGWYGLAATAVLYFVHKGKSAFVTDHARQALGVQVFGVLLGLVTRTLFGVGTVGGLAFSLLTGNFGLALFTGLVNLVLGILSTIVGIMMLIWVITGAVSGFKGKEYRYPYFGNWVAGLKF